MYLELKTSLRLEPPFVIVIVSSFPIVDRAITFYPKFSVVQVVNLRQSASSRCHYRSGGKKLGSMTECLISNQ